MALSTKALFICNGVLSQIGDRMWFFAAYLLLAKAFPGSRLTLGAIYGLSISVSSAILASSVGAWIDKTPRLRAAIILLIVQNMSVAIAAVIEIFGITLNTEISKETQYVMIGLVTVLGCTGMLGHVGMSIVLERDWIPEVFKGEGLTVINAWVRMIDQGAMLLGPALAGGIIGLNPAVGAGFIAVWNVFSLFVEIYFLKLIYNSTEALQAPKDISSEDTFNIKKSLIEWKDSWSQWLQSPTFIPGLALALLFANVFQLSYIAQGYITLHCISDYFMAIIWITSGVFGLLGTYFYRILVGRIGLVFTSVIGGVLHIIFVFGTIGGLFAPGSHYAVYNSSSLKLVYEPEECAEVQSPAEMANKTETFITSYSTECAPPTELNSIIILIACCALSRCGLWLFDLAVNQMFQEWVKPNQRGVVSGAQNGVQNMFDCVHYGIVFVWGDQCLFGHAMILTCLLMVLGYTNLFISAGVGKFKDIEIYEEDDSLANSIDEKRSIVNQNGEISTNLKTDEMEKMLK